VLEPLPPYCCLVFIEAEADKRTRLYKLFEKAGLVAEFPYQAPEELSKWVAMIARHDGMAFEPRALRLFMERCGDSMTEVRSELDKLLLYARGKQRVEPEDVWAVCSFSLKTRIFDLMDAVAAGDTRKALNDLESLLSLREPVQKISVMLSRHLAQLWQVKRLAAAGMGADAVASRMQMNPYRARILWRQSARFGAGQLEAAVRRCYEQDVAVKTGRLPGELALEMLIASIKT